jgi:kinesin family member 11
MDTQLESLDEIISRVKAQNKSYHESHSITLDMLSGTVKDSYTDISNQIAATSKRIQDLQVDLEGSGRALEETLIHLEPNSRIRSSLQSLQEEFSNPTIKEYESTGQTPRQADYSYPTFLPKTKDHTILLERFRGSSNLEVDDQFNPSPSKTRIFIDNDEYQYSPSHLKTKFNSKPTSSSLQKLDVNRYGLENTSTSDTDAITDKNMLPPPHKKQMIAGFDRSECDVPKKTRALRMTVAGGNVAASDRENIQSMDFSKSVGSASARRLRSHGRQ